jgi:hypothetical protein
MKREAPDMYGVVGSGKVSYIKLLDLWTFRLGGFFIFHYIELAYANFSTCYFKFNDKFKKLT